MGFRREGAYAVAAVLVFLVFAAVLFAGSAWSQDKNGDSKKDRKETRQEKRSAKTSERASDKQRAQIERLNNAQIQDELVQAAQTSNAAGDLSEDEAEGQDDEDSEEFVDRIVIRAEGCEVANDATITFEDREGNVGFVENGDNVDIQERTDRIIVTAPSGGDIEFFGVDNLVAGPLEILASSGIDCDGDNDDGFDDELLLLLLLELLENNNDNPFDDNPFDGDDDFFDEDDFDEDNDGIPDPFDEDFDEDGDEDEDGDIDQDDEFLDAQNDLDDDGEITDGEFTDADDFDDDGPVSATAEDGQAEASTPGAVARSGGDPDELEPLTSVPDDVEDEIPTSGPLPNTAGSIWVYVMPGLGCLLLLTLLVKRIRGSV